MPDERDYQFAINALKEQRNDALDREADLKSAVTRANQVIDSQNQIILQYQAERDTANARHDNNDNDDAGLPDELLPSCPSTEDRVDYSKDSD